MTRDSRGLYDAVAVACRMNGDKRVFPFTYEGIHILLSSI